MASLTLPPSIFTPQHISHMNSVASTSYSQSDSSLPPFSHRSDHSRALWSDMRTALSSTMDVLEQSPPPSLRDILGAYKAKGDGDREMLLAMLNAKSAEDQRLAAVASLHRHVLEIYQSSTLAPMSPPQQIPHLQMPLHHYPTPQAASPPYRQTPPVSYERRSGSPPMHSHSNSHRRRHQAPAYTNAVPEEHPPRKRHRSSHSPQSSSNGSNELPPSPRSDSAEYSPRSRASMAIGSLLSSGDGPRKEEDSQSHAQSLRSSRGERDHGSHQTSTPVSV